MKVLVIEPEKMPYVKEIDGELRTLQGEVGGYIEIFGLEENVDIICNEKGKISNLPLCRAIWQDDGMIEVIAGKFLIIGLENDKFCSLSEEQIRKYTERFLFPEGFLSIKNSVISVKFDLPKLEIYQMRDRKSIFLGYQQLQDKGFSITKKNYKQVYAGYCNLNESVEDIFMRFNLSQPYDYTARSLSVSDVIVYENDFGEKESYFIDCIGYKYLKNF